jgi:hypothetical protein
MNKKVFGTIAGASLIAGAITAVASSHREAPMIAEDQFVDNTDVYAFISPTDSNKLVMVADYIPLLLPSSGPNFYRFAEDAHYDINIDNDGDAVTDITYRYEFDTETKNGNTFLYNVGPVDSINSANLNVTQTYTLWKIAGGKKTKVMEGVPTAPWNVGKRSFPNYEQVALQAVKSAGGTSTFAGPRDEPFFVDLHVFDVDADDGWRQRDVDRPRGSDQRDRRRWCASDRDDGQDVGRRHLRERIAPAGAHPSPWPRRR